MGRSTLALYLCKNSKKRHLSSSEDVDVDASMAKNIEEAHSEEEILRPLDSTKYELKIEPVRS